VCVSVCLSALVEALCTVCRLLFVISLYLQPPQNDDAVKWFKKAANLGCPYATYELWQLDAGDKRWTAVEEIQLVRRLRALASGNIWPACLDLCLAYINHQYGGISKDQATQFVKHVSLAC